jgi:opacity protein-like surface antigen
MGFRGNHGMSRPLAVVFVVLLIVAGSGSILADDGSETADTSSASDEWRYGFAPYIWTAGLSGTVGSFGLPPVNVDVSAQDVIENLDMAFMGVGIVQHGRWGLYTDIVYSDLSTNSTNTPGPFFGSAKLKAKTFFMTPMLEYQAIGNGWSELYPMAGMRVWYSETTISLTGGLLNGRSSTDSASWVDPTIGLRGRIKLDENLWLNGWGIIGGFGVDHDEFMWDVLGGVNYELNDWASVEVGYRATGTDYSNDGYVFDITMQGPVIGAVFQF